MSDSAIPPVSIPPGGTTILDGSGIPPSGVGVEDNYYLNVSNDTLYGPKSEAGWGALQYGLPTTTPTDSSTSGGYELGNRFIFHQPVQIVGLRWYRPSGTAGTSRKFRLWSNAGVLVAETVDTVESAGVAGYIEASFTTPIIAVDEATYITAYTAASGQFMWGVVAPTNPNPGAVTFLDGVYGTTLGGVPNISQGGSINRFIDPIYQESSADVWPVGVTGVPTGGASGQVLAKTTSTNYDVNWAAPSAGAGDANFIFSQLSPSVTWNVPHNLGKFPSIEVVDSGGSTIVPNILYVDSNNLTVSFGAATSGKVYCN